MKKKPYYKKDAHCSFVYSLDNLKFLSPNDLDIRTMKIGNTTFMWSKDPFQIGVVFQKGDEPTILTSLPIYSEKVCRILDTIELKNDNMLKEKNVYITEIITYPGDSKKITYKKVFQNRPDQYIPDNIYKFEETYSINLFIDKEPFGIVGFCKNEVAEVFPCEKILTNGLIAMKHLALPYFKTLPEYEQWLSK